MKRFYYKKDGKPAYNLKQPLSTILDDTTGYEEITEEEWNQLNIPPKPSKKAKQKWEASKQIIVLKAQLAATDYKAIKFAEGCYTEEEYAPIKAEREQLREQIRALEATL